MSAQDVEATASGEESGSKTELKELRRNFNFWSLCGVGLMTGSTWLPLGGSIIVVLYNGGAPGAIYELIATSVFYWMIAACIAELASAIPSSAGVYHFAAVASGPKHGRVVSWYSGWFNALAWTFGAASVNSVLANQILTLWGLFHREYVLRQWHLFVIYLALTWIMTAVVLFCNRALPLAGDIGAALIILGFVVVVVTCAVMPTTTGAGYASSHFVWKDWVNLTGYKSDGFVFLMGMLNGAYAVGTPDVVTHLAEEIPRPRENVPKAIGIQLSFGFVTAIAFLVTVFYSVHDPTKLFGEDSSIFPMVDVFLQATGTKAGATALVMIMVVNNLFMGVGVYLTASRIIWTLARDNAIPFSGAIARIHPRWENPFGAILVCGGIATVMSFIYLGSSAAFSAFVGSFVTLTTISYLGAILPYLVTGRKHVAPGWFRMPRAVFVPAATLACAYIIAFVVIFCFPYSQPVAAASMNYTSAIVGGIAVLMGAYWFAMARHRYKGPGEELLRRIQGINQTVLGEEDRPDLVAGGGARHRVHCHLTSTA